MNICVVGTGYVGLVTGTCFADLGLNVTCIDRDEAKVEGLKAGRVPIFEPGLDAMVVRNHEEGRLDFSSDLAVGLDRALVVFLAVGTPTSEDGEADLSAIEAVAREIGRNLGSYKVVVTKSTVPAGTGARIRQWIEAEQSTPVSFDIVSNPEFLREGSAIEDFMQPDRIVVGTESSQATAILQDLYRPITALGAPLVVTNVETAEMIKYASNAFLATKVAFINEVAGLCERVGADVKQVSRGMGLDARIGQAFLNPGPGYGGSCFPKDTKAFASLGRRLETPLQIVEAAIDGNRVHMQRCLEKARQVLDEANAKGKTLAVLGLSFKPNTDDMRDSPTIPLVQGLLEDGHTIRAFDPEALERAQEIMPEIQPAKDAYDAVQGAAAVLILTEWNQFRALRWKDIQKRMQGELVLDFRNLYEPAEMAGLGFEYHGVGRPFFAPEEVL